MDGFAALVPISDRYATLPVAEAFDWRPAAAELPVGHEWYMVAFRSVRRADADEARLCDYDERAHQEAATSPGFVHYFKGPTSSDGSCMSFCLWSSRSDAREASGRPAHQEAVTLIREMYERYTLEFHRVRRREDGTGLDFEPYDRVPAAVA